jgi:starch-binding outer membrane protein SusE/F
MNNIIKLSFTFLIAGALFSCKKNVSKISYEGSTDPVLSANRTTTIPLSFATKDNEAITLNWTNPNYQFSTGTSSHDVSYKVEIDTTNANFTNPNKKVIGISRDLSLTMTQTELNDYLLNQLNLVAGIPHNIEFRVVASLINNSLPTISNVLKYTVTPYAIPPKVTPPSTNELFITGAATPAGWMSGGDPDNAAQKFTRVSPTLYVLNSINLNADASYLFVPNYGDWGAKYGFAGSNNANNVNGDDLAASGGDMKSPPAAGAYKIEVDFQRGKFTLTKL